MAANEHTSAGIYSAIFDEAETETNTARQTRPRISSNRATEDHNERFEAAYAQWLQLPREQRDPRDEAEWRERRQLTLRLLEEHAAGRANLPGDVAFELILALRALEAGDRPPLLWPRRRQGRGYSADELSCIHDAVAYVIAAREGTIVDVKRRSTIASAYGVSPSQVDQWVRGYERQGREILTHLKKKLSNEALARRLSLLVKKSGKRFICLGVNKPTRRRLRGHRTA